MLDFGKEEHKEEWYTNMVPNGRIPMIVDHWNNDKVVWESNSVMKYLASRYDIEKQQAREIAESLVDEQGTWDSELAWKEVLVVSQGIV